MILCVNLSQKIRQTKKFNFFNEIYESDFVRNSN